MAITKEQVQEEAKKFGLTLSDEQIDAHILIGTLPLKPEEEEEEEEEEELSDEEKKKLSEGMQKRLKQLAEQKNKHKKEATEAKKKLKEIEDANTKADKKKLEDDGKHKELADQEKIARKKAEEKVEASKDSLMCTAIKQKIEVALLAEGLPSDRLSKALKLFDVMDVEFEWTDEDKMTYEIGDTKDLVATFKKENDFMFEGAGEDDNDDDTTGNQTPKKRKPGSTPKVKTLDDKEKERLRKRFSALN